VRIDASGLTTMTAASPERVSTPLDFTPDEMLSIHAALLEADVFAFEGTTVLEPGIRSGPSGLEVVVMREPPFVRVTVDDQSHSLDVWHNGTSRRFYWGVRFYDDADRLRPDTAQDMAAVGVLIRAIVRNKPAVQALPPDDRPCLDR
jgi:hypothetical protein